MEKQIKHVAMQSAVYTAGGALLIGWQYGWKTGLAVYLLAWALQPVLMGR